MVKWSCYLANSNVHIIETLLALAAHLLDFLSQHGTVFYIFLYNNVQETFVKNVNIFSSPAPDNLRISMIVYQKNSLSLF